MENNSLYENVNTSLISILCRNPQAFAEIKGSKDYKQISGIVKFYQTANGTLVYATVTELPEKSGFHGFHIHEGKKCSGNKDDPFADVKSHYNPSGSTHPNHAGDLPPLINNNGFALSIFITDRFTVDEIIEKTVIIHEKADDFTTQPSGNSGKKIACGEIIKYNRK